MQERNRAFFLVDEIWQYFINGCGTNSCPFGKNNIRFLSQSIFHILDKLKIHLKYIHTRTNTHNYKSIQRKYCKSENFLPTISTASEVRVSNLTTKALKLYNKDSTKLMDKGAKCENICNVSEYP